jgi:outer membrane protein TolC
MTRLSLPSLVATVFLAGCSAHPDMLTDDDLTRFAELNAETLVADQEPISAPITLHDAMARALKYNLDHRVEMMAATLAARAADVKSAAMLPQIAAGADYDGRDKTAGSYSRSIPGGTRSAGASTSSENESLSADITASWSILDFGLSYVRAKQAGDEALIANERKRKMVNKIIQDVRTSYWRAVTGEQLLAGFKRLEGRVNTALANSRSLSHSGALAPLTALTYQRELVEIRKQIHEIELDLATSKIELAALMNIPPNTRYQLATPSRSMVHLHLKKNAGQLIDIAMLNRPELREAFLKERITSKDIDAAMLEMLPGVQVFGGLNWDSNDLLYHSNWVSWGARASWNVMKVFSLPAVKARNEAQSGLERQRSLAMTMAVLTQVHAARAGFYQSEKIYKDASDYLAIQQKILAKVRSSAEVDSEGEQALIREEMNTLVGTVKRDVAHARLQNAYAKVFESVGIDPYGKGIDGSESIKVLSTSLRSTWVERGDSTGM